MVFVYIFGPVNSDLILVAFSALCVQSIVHAPSTHPPTPPPIHTQTLARWSRGNPCSLCSLLEELLSEYKSHHRLIVEQQQRLKFELSTLEGGDCFSNVDVHCTKPSDKVRGYCYYYYYPIYCCSNVSNQ